MRGLAPLLVLAMLAGCAVPPLTPVAKPKSAADFGLSAAPAPLIADDWWRAMGDPQLDRIVADALSDNPTLAQGLARIAQAQALLATRRAEDGPSVTLDGQAQVARLSGRYTIPPPYAGSVRFVGQASANLSWNLDLFGRQQAAIEGARASARAAALDLAAARLAIAGSVAQAYVDLARAERQAALARRTIDTRAGALRLVQVRIRNKLASKLDAQAAETVLTQARAALIRAAGDRALAANALAALAGRGPDYAAAIAPATIDLDTTLPMAPVIPADLLARRADIAAAAARIDAAAAGRQVARRAFYPNVNLAALAGLQAIGIGNLLSLDAGTRGVGPAIHLPIFDNGRLRAEFAGATAALELAVAGYDEQVTGAVRETADAAALVANLAGQHAEQARVVRGFRETGRLNAIRVSSGLDSRLDLIDNDIRQLDAEQTDADLAAAAARQRIALVLALGGGFTLKDMPK